MAHPDLGLVKAIGKMRPRLDEIAGDDSGSGLDSFSVGDEFFGIERADASAQAWASFPPDAIVLVGRLTEADRATALRTPTLPWWTRGSELISDGAAGSGDLRGHRECPGRWNAAQRKS